MCAGSASIRQERKDRSGAPIKCGSEQDELPLPEVSSVTRALTFSPALNDSTLRTLKNCVAWKDDVRIINKTHNLFRGPWVDDCGMEFALLRKFEGSGTPPNKRS